MKKNFPKNEIKVDVLEIDNTNLDNENENNTNIYEDDSKSKFLFQSDNLNKLPKLFLKQHFFRMLFHLM